MRRSRVRLVLIVGMVAALGVVAFALRAPLAQADGAQKAAVATRAREILEQHCTKCHAAERPRGDLNVLDRGSLLDAARADIAVVLGKPDESNLIQRILSTSSPMPPKSQKNPVSAADVKVLRQWIEDGAGVGARATDPNAELAGKAREILQEYCVRCHGHTAPKAKLNVMDLASLRDSKRSLQGKAAIVPGKPDESDLIAQIVDGVMPMPEKSQKVPDEKLKTLKQWIAAGAPAFPVPETVKEVQAVALKEAPAKRSLPERVETLFRAKCSSCHAGSKPEAGLRILNHKDLLAKKYVVPGSPGESSLLARINAADDAERMPPNGQGNPALTADEKQDVEQWITASALPFSTLAADGASTDYVLQQIAADVTKLRAAQLFKVADLKYYRYVSFNHLLAAGVSKDELQAHVQSLTLAINHASEQTDFEKPVPLDGTADRPATVFRINLQNLGWHEPAFSTAMADGRKLTLWDLVALEYPYAMLPTGSPLYPKVALDYLSHTEQVRPILYVRGDWLMTAVTRSPLYEDLLRLPFDLSKLEERLGVDSTTNVEESLARRGGVTVSGVSRNNRVVERHKPRGTAYYWKSFDFKSSTGLENMFRDPVNLNQSGGEMIWSLPNGLQAYYVCDAKGNRIEAAPTEIVTDEFSSDKTVRNGLACVRCHKVGIRTFQDDVLPALTSFAGSSRTFSMEHVEKLYAPREEMDSLLKKDGSRFTEAIVKLFGEKRTDGSVIIAPSQRFLEEKVTGLTAAAELGRSNLDEARAQFRSADAVKLGMPQLAVNGAVRRDAWEDYYDQVVRGMALGEAAPNINAVTRRDYQPLEARFEMEVTLNKPVADEVRGKRKLLNIVVENKTGRNFFAAQDAYAIQVINNTSSDVHLEGYVNSFKGEKKAMGRLTIRAGESGTWVEGKIGAAAGSEQLVFYASDDEKFPRGELMKVGSAQRDRGEVVAARVVHPLYELRPGRGVETKFEPHRIVKRTFDVETR